MKFFYRHHHHHHHHHHFSLVLVWPYSAESWPKAPLISIFHQNCCYHYHILLGKCWIVPVFSVNEFFSMAYKNTQPTNPLNSQSADHTSLCVSQDLSWNRKYVTRCPSWSLLPYHRSEALYFCPSSSSKTAHWLTDNWPLRPWTITP